MSVKPPIVGAFPVSGAFPPCTGQCPPCNEAAPTYLMAGIHRAVWPCGRRRPIPIRTNKPGGADAPPTVFKEDKDMAFFNSAIGVLQTLVVALGAGLGVWGAINLLEGYGNDNPGANAHVR